MIFSIRAKMIVTLLVLIVSPIIVLGVLSYQKTAAILLDKAKHHSQQTIENARVFFIEDFFTDTELAIEIFVNNPALGQSEAPLTEWAEYRRYHPNMPAIYFGTADGRLYLSTDSPHTPRLDPRKRPWYQQAEQSPGTTVWSNVYLDTLTNRPVITAARAVYADGELKGVLGIDISLYLLAEIVKKIYFEQGGYAILIDYDGQIIAHPDPAQMGKTVTDAWFEEIRTEPQGVLLASRGDKDTFVSYITVPKTGWKLVGFIPQENVEHELAPVKFRTQEVGGGAAIFALLLGIIVASNIAARLRGLVGAMTRVQNGDFTARWQDKSAVEFAAIGDKFTAMVTTLENLIKQEQAAQQEIVRQKEYFAQLFENSPESIAIMDTNDRVIQINQQFTKMFGYTSEEAVGRFINDLVVPEELSEEGKAVSNSVLGNQIVELETLRKCKDGRLIDVFILGYPIIVMGKPMGGYVIYRDISDRKEGERRLTHASTHDLLTGTFNRRYFEQEMQRLDTSDYPAAGIIISDIDGLKLVNDTLGHAVGDDLLLQAARILQENIPAHAVLCRIGGDEFAILIPVTDETSLQQNVDRVKAGIAADNLLGREYVLSISLGFAVRSATSGMDDAYREADSRMYREKLHRSASTRSALVKTLTEALHARDFITEGHADRLQELVEKLARAVGIPERRIGDLRLLAQFHDIGKVGIPDSILFKNDRLTESEKKVMRRHSEIGYRIAVASPDFHHIADWILKHHEWWNGGGYPLGLKGGEIPVECRILLIADAFDAMTQDRPYRQAMPVGEALKEIGACKGQMFDPALADKFIALFDK